jgi:hypothetical protein
MANTFKLPPGIVCHPPNPPTKAQSDYIQNGIQLPKRKANLQKLLNQMRLQGYFNNEFNYALRKKESFQDFVRRIKDQIKDADKNSEDEVSHAKTTRYEPMIASNGFEEEYKTTLNSLY